MLFSLAGCTTDATEALIDTALDYLLEGDGAPAEETPAPEESAALPESPAPPATQPAAPEPSESVAPAEEPSVPQVETSIAGSSSVSEDGQYSDKEHVALYLHTYGHLPDNFLTKSKAEELGWVSGKGNLWDVAPGMSIGGDRFGNREGLLPDVSNRKWYECDIGYEGGFRGSIRIVFSNDGLIYYTEDHYESFTQLY